MAVFPSEEFALDVAKVRWREPFLSSAVNRKMLPMPIGVYRGFTPSVEPGEIIRLTPDGTTNDHVAVVEADGHYSASVPLRS